jgi:thioredoxin-dependent peroxiredoxin
MRRMIRLLSGAIAGGALLGAFAIVPRAVPVADELKVGDEAPDFTLPGSDGKTYTLSQLKGQHVVLAWFPKAFTGG